MQQYTVCQDIGQKYILKCCCQSVTQQLFSVAQKCYRTTFCCMTVTTVNGQVAKSQIYIYKYQVDVECHVRFNGQSCSRVWQAELTFIHELVISVIRISDITNSK